MGHKNLRSLQCCKKWFQSKSDIHVFLLSSHQLHRNRWKIHAFPSNPQQKYTPYVPTSFPKESKADKRINVAILKIRPSHGPTIPTPWLFPKQISSRRQPRGDIFSAWNPYETCIRVCQVRVSISAIGSRGARRISREQEEVLSAALKW